MKKNILICGLGALGITYAARLNNIDKFNLKILVDESRIERYTKNKPVFNEVVQNFDYILPSAQFDADLIIVCTKMQGLDDAISYMKNFVSSKTVIISLINGISSEEKIKKAFPEAKVLKSYFIGHSAERVNNSVIQDGVGKIVSEYNAVLKEVFEQAGINYEFSDDINYSMWLKYTLNVFSNQTSAILKMSFGELKHNDEFIKFAKKIINEVRQIAEKKGVKNLENLERDALKALDGMCDSGKTSMLQDILAKRHTEVDIFAGELNRLGKELGVETPYNKVLYDLIKIEEARW
mgnify:CR=1 FL=1